MSEYKYKPTTWIGGKTIGTADVMNNIEDGITKAHERLDNLGDISSGGGNGNVDLSDYATKEELTTLESSLSNCATKEELTALENNLSSCATKEELETLENTLNDHLENHPTGGGELPTDYGELVAITACPPGLPDGYGKNIIRFITGLGVERYIALRNDEVITNSELYVNAESIYVYTKYPYYYTNSNNINEWKVEVKNQYYFGFKEIISSSLDIYNKTGGIFFKKNTDTEHHDYIEVQKLRGTNSAISTYFGKQGQIVINTDDNTIHVMDGETLGGTKLATKEELEMINSKLNEIIEYIHNIPSSGGSFLKATTKLNTIKSNNLKEDGAFKISKKLNIDNFSINSNIKVGIE